MSRIVFSAAAAAAAFALFACGGSSESAPSGAASTYGVTVDAPVSCEAAPAHDAFCASPGNTTATHGYTCPTNGNGVTIVVSPPAGCGDANPSDDPNVAIVCCP